MHKGKTWYLSNCFTFWENLKHMSESFPLPQLMGSLKFRRHPKIDFNQCTIPPRWRSLTDQLRSICWQAAQRGTRRPSHTKVARAACGSRKTRSWRRNQTARWGLTCISSSFDCISGGKSAAPQVKGSNGSAPKRSLPTTTITRSRERALAVSPCRLPPPPPINMTWPIFLTMSCHFTDFLHIFLDGF